MYVLEFSVRIFARIIQGNMYYVKPFASVVNKGSLSWSESTTHSTLYTTLLHHVWTHVSLFQNTSYAKYWRPSEQRPSIHICLSIPIITGSVSLHSSSHPLGFSYLGKIQKKTWSWKTDRHFSWLCWPKRSKGHCFFFTIVRPTLCQYE